MSLCSLTPAGNPISLTARKFDDADILPGYNVTFVQSGTAALAVALQAALAANPTEQPEVIVPGYCCPDLLSAAVFAGYKPVVVDIAEQDAAINLSAVTTALTEKTRAVIAINFLGLKDRIADIRAAVQDFDHVVVIEDNAQWFPNADQVDSLQGDIVTFSFGRGKAVSLLGGGMVAVPVGSQLKVEVSPSSEAKDAKWPIKVGVMALMSNPVLYYWIQRLSFLNLGATEYHKLEIIEGLPVNKKACLSSNIDQYRGFNQRVEQLFTAEFADLNQLTSLNDRTRCGRLLRYPLLLASAEKRDVVLQKLNASGLGASAMYQTDLSRVAGVEKLGISFPTLENAASFATRFLTLPVHQGVRRIDAERIIDVIKG